MKTSTRRASADNQSPAPPLDGRTDDVSVSYATFVPAAITDAQFDHLAEEFGRLAADTLLK